MRFKPIPLVLMSVAATAVSSTASADWGAWISNQMEKAQSAYAKYSGQGDASKSVSLNLCLASEKKKWANETLGGFQSQHPNIKANLVLKGSGELVNDVLGANKFGCDAISPASSIWGAMLRDRVDNVADAVPMAFSPTVVIAKSEKAEAFRQYLGGDQEISFKALADASGKSWEDIGGDKRWGSIKIGHTDPEKSNSGLSFLVALANEAVDTYEGLVEADLENEALRSALSNAGANTKHRKSSTGKLTKSYMQRGDMVYNFAVTYENLAVDVANKKKGVEIIYPSYSVLNDHPYYVVTKDADKAAAAMAYLAYMTGKQAQTVALNKHGFRPANVDVDMFNPQSPFVKMQGKLQEEPAVIEAPESAEIVNTLIAAFKGELE